ncbi:MAG: hypothetical protein IGS48_20945 [Oscillatoriales cyanobacterium C42_A2020_001]|nr:hypothetical protein [Leptolyngbyaceae cyanobacterium C42_A2020_001]
MVDSTTVVAIFVGFMLSQSLFAHSRLIILKRMLAHAVLMAASLSAIAPLLNGWQIAPATAAENSAGTFRVAFLHEFPHDTTAIALGRPISTDYALYCQPQDIPQERPICLGGIGGEVDASVTPAEEANLEPVSPPNPLDLIDPYQYDKAQIFPLP